MIHHATKRKPATDHWAVSWTGAPVPEATGPASQVLVQLQEEGEQVRVALTPEEAEAMAQQLFDFAQRALAANAAITLPGQSRSHG